MLQYHLYIETYRLDFSPPTDTRAIHTCYSKNDFERDWKLINTHPNSNTLCFSKNQPNSANPSSQVNKKALKSLNATSKETQIPKTVKDQELLPFLPKDLILDTPKIKRITKLNDYFSKNCDNRFGTLNIETYLSQDLSIPPEIEELETRFYKISFSNSQGPASDQFVDANLSGDYEIGISWEPKNAHPETQKLQIASHSSAVKMQEPDLVHFGSTVVQNSAIADIDTSNPLTREPEIFNHTLGSRPDTQSFFGKKSQNQSIIPMGIFEISPSSNQEFPLGVLHLYKSDSAPVPGISSASYGQKYNNNATIPINSAHQNSSLSRDIVIPVENGKTLAVLAVPGYMTPSDFVSFVGMFRKKISQFRVIRNSSMSNYMVLLKFRDLQDSEEFFEYYNGKSFSPLEPETCNIVNISSITIANGALPVYLFPLFYDEIPLYNEGFNKDVISERDEECTIAPEFSAEDHTPGASLPKANKSEISNIEFIRELNLERSNLHKSLSLNKITELPTCPVCLERLDTSASGLLTILCQHTFHCTCLEKWSDSSCPVCRFAQAGMFVNNDLFDEMISRERLGSVNLSYPNNSAISNNLSDGPNSGFETSITQSSSGTDVVRASINPANRVNQQNQCAICGSKEQLWICLICGYIGCGRYFSGHAHAHFLESGHIYSMDLDSQRVWDYVGDGYVHRILLNRADGKLVELSAPDPNIRQDADGSEDLNSSVLVPDGSNSLSNSSLRATQSLHEPGSLYSENIQKANPYSGDILNIGGSLNTAGFHITSFEPISSNAGDSYLHSTQRNSGPIDSNSNGKVRSGLGTTSSSQLLSSTHAVRNIDAVREKLAAVATEYEITLKAQLETNARAFEEKTRALENLCKEYAKKQHLAKQNLTLTQQKLEEEKSMSKSMSQNFKKLQEENEKLKATVDDLKEQVKDLCLHFETLNKVENNSDLKQAINNGTIQVHQGSSKKGKNKGKKHTK